MKLGMVTYLWGADWDLETLIRNCEQTKFEGVELRSTHKHGVEVTLNASERNNVRQRFADSPVRCVGVGSACEFHATAPQTVKENIELAKKFVVLSHDIGASGVKVRPNGLNKGEDTARTIERIGMALRVCGEFASGYGQEIRLEVHGRETKQPKLIAQMMQIADHPNVKVCWNSNPGETIDGSIAANFALIKPHLSDVVHIHDLFDEKYPYRELFRLLREADYAGYCLSESPSTKDPIRVMHYYRALFNELIRDV